MHTLDTQSLNELEVSHDKELRDIAVESSADFLSIILDAVNSSLGGLIITDLNGKICFANPAFCSMLEYSQQEIIGSDAADIFSSKAVQKMADVINIIDISQDNLQEFVLQATDGQNCFMEVSATDVTSADGRIVGRMASFTDISSRKKIEFEQQALIKQLQEALDKIKVLRGIIPICCSCKKIRDDKGFWNQIENYIKEHSDASFSHGLCPDCAKQLYPEVFKD